MVYLRLSGGLGNQLFQFSISYYLAKKYSQKLIIDVSSLSNYSSPRELELFKYLNFPDGVEICNDRFSPYRFFFNKLRLARILSFSCDFFTFLNDKTIGKIEDLDNVTSENYFIDGYFISSIGQGLFCLLNDLIIELIKSDLKMDILSSNKENMVIHIRGGDFLNLPQYNVCTEKYYRDAIEKIEYENESVIIVTDDKSYAESLIEKLGFKLDYEFSSGSMYDDFVTMSSAKILIGSNSTFCFWAAAFTDDICNKKSIFPEYWEKGVPKKIHLQTEFEGLVMRD